MPIALSTGPLDKTSRTLEGRGSRHQRRPRPARRRRGARAHPRRPRAARRDRTSRHRREGVAARADGLDRRPGALMTAAPRVSIVLPVFRAAAFLPRAVDQLVALDYPDLEVVIVDDGSGDDTAETARVLTADDDRIRVVELPRNGGVARARRAGVEAATGEYVWFVDADDAWSPDALRTLVGMATARDADVVVAAATLVTRGGDRRPLVPPVSPPVSGRAAFRMLLRGEITGHLWNKMFRRDTCCAPPSPRPGCSPISPSSRTRWGTRRRWRSPASRSTTICCATVRSSPLSGSGRTPSRSSTRRSPPPPPAGPARRGRPRVLPRAVHRAVGDQGRPEGGLPDI